VVAVLALPILILAAAMDPVAALCALSIAPLLSFRAAATLRREREQKAASASLLMEGTFISAAVALLPISCLIWLALAPAALMAARQAELKLKPTRWVERHHMSAGDSLSWSE
jgi:large-conductance mechanosensitive channel